MKPGGSSPLARGLLRRRRRIARHVRIIPARAGFTSIVDRGSISTRDHPRSRGVYRGVGGQELHVNGSSPLARGLPPRRYLSRTATGIIPARAGFTRFTSRAGPRAADHPRSRGVYIVRPESVNADDGSSPLARGLHGDPTDCPRDLRIIPARAGFTGRPYCRRLAEGDHPRSRGVYRICSPDAGLSAGSSPLARGLPTSEDLGRQVEGIIPARAGFTRDLPADGDDLWDHPRSRGVYSTDQLTVTGTAGSSPLARGLRAHTRTRA